MGSTYIQNSLNAGELTPTVAARTDLSKYYSGAEIVSNYIPQVQGGVIKRSGGIWIAKAKGACRVIPFSYSASDSMVIEAGNLYMRFYKDQDRVMTDSETIAGITLPSGAEVIIEVTGHPFATGDIVRFTSVGGTTELNYAGLETEFTITKTGANTFTLDSTDGDDFTAWTTGGTVAAIYEIVTPYSATEIFDVHTTPIADVVRLVHEDYYPRKLSRLADNSWTVATIEPAVSEYDTTAGPFLERNTDTTRTLRTNKHFGGAHTGANNASVLTDSGKAWAVDELIGLTVYNKTDGSSGTITDNDATTITATLGGGADDDWDTGDTYYIDSLYHIKEGTTGITLTATGHTPFEADHVGSYWLLEHTRADNTADIAAVGTSSEVRTKGSFTLDTSGYAANAVVDLQRKVGNGDFQSFRKFTSATSYAGVEPANNVKYRVVVTVGNATAKFVAQDQVARSVLKVTAYVSSSVVTCTAMTQIYFNDAEADNITSMWAEGAWSEVRGYPRTCTIYENRTWYGGTDARPQDIYYSRSGEYDDMTDGPYDDDGGTITLNDPDVSQIEWIVGFQRLFVGTSKKEYMISASNPDDPITPNDVVAKVQSSFGSAHIQPVILNNAVFFAQRQGRSIRLITLNDYGDRQVTEHATRLSNHIFESSPIEFAVQNTPESCVWIPRTDGQAPVFVYDPQEEIAAWSRIVTGSVSDSPTDKYKSFAIIPGTSEDEVWYAANRTINGSSVTYIEVLGPRVVDQIDAAIMVDSAKVVESVYSIQNIICASDTIRCGEGACGSGPCGGII